MPCRHTVPDWHRYVEANPAAPIFAGCRLLIKEGERSSDPRAIACAFWGHQADCPQYDGPGKRNAAPAAGPGRAVVDEPLPPEGAWPLRAPGAPDRMRTGLIGLLVVAIAFLLLGLIGLGSGWTGGAAGRVLVGAGLGFSVVTHVLALVRIWAGR
jgi:hypothetical protein